MAFLWDTDWTVDFLNGQQAAVRLFAEQADDGISISIVTYAELYEGVLGSNHQDTRLKQLNEFVDGIDVIPIAFAIAQRFAEIRRTLRSAGQPIPDTDVFIAATAMSNSLTVVTRDRHFDRVPGLSRHAS